MTAHRYQISIHGRLSDGLASAFAPLQVRHDTGCTALIGELEDQSALYGVLNQIQAFGRKLE